MFGYPPTRRVDFCNNRSHGITCLNSAIGPGAFCQVCGKAVKEEDVKPRTEIERLRGIVSNLRLMAEESKSLKRFCLSVEKRMMRELEKRLGHEDKNPTIQAPRI